MQEICLLLIVSGIAIFNPLINAELGSDTLKFEVESPPTPLYELQNNYGVGNRVRIKFCALVLVPVVWPQKL